MAAATDAVWIDVLPSMRGFGPALSQGVGREAERAGSEAGGKFGKAMLAGVAVVAGGAALATKALYNIGSTFNDLRTTVATGTGAVGKDLDRMVETSKRVGKTVPRSFEDIGAAVVAVRSSIKGAADMSDADFDRMTANALNFSKAFEIDMGRATQVAGQMMKAGLVKDGDEAFDLLTASMQKVPVAVREDILDATDEYGPFFAQLGVSGTEAMNSLVKASEKGMYGIDKTGDAIKEFTIRATDMSTASKVGYDLLGMSQERMSGQLLKGGETGSKAFQKILDGLMAMKDPVAQSQAALALFGTPLEDLSTGEIPQFIDGLRTSTNVLGDVQGAAGRMGEQINSGPGAAFQLFKNRLIDVVAPAAERVFGLLTTGLESLNTSGFIDWVKEAAGYFTGTFLPGLRDASDTVLPILKTTFEGIGDAVMGVVGFFKEHDTALTTLKGTVAVVAGFIAGAWVAQSAVATVNAVKSVIAWFSVATASTTSATIQSRSTAQIVAGWLIASGSAVVNAVKIAAAWAVSVAQTGYLMALYASQSVASAARSAGAWVMAQLRTVASLALTAASFVASGAVMLFQMGVTAAGVVAGWVVMGVQSLIQAGRMAAAWLIAMGPVGWVIAAVIGLVALIIANWDTVVSWTKTAWDAVTGAISWAWEMIKTGVKAALDFLVWLFLNFTGPGLLIKHWDSIVQGAKNAWHWVVDNFTRMKDGVVGVFQGIVDTASSIWNGLLEVLKTPIRIAFDFVNGNMINPINEILKQFPGGLHIPSLPKLASGGLLRGPGTGTSDSILGVDPISKMPTAAVSNGEFVVKKKRVDQVGVGWLNAFNEGRLPGLATGGLAGLPKFGLGGWISGAWDATGGAAWDAAKGAVSSVKNFATDMLAKGARKAAEWVLKPLVDGAKSIIPNKVPLNMLTGGLDKLYQGIMGKADEQDREQQLSGGGFSSDSRRTPNGVGGLGPVAAAARLDVMKRFGLTNIGGYSYRTIAGTNTLSDHATGHAIDVMIPNYKSAAGISKGNAVANYFTGEGASRYPVKYVIWRDQINEGKGWKPYGHPGGGRSDTLQHRDHDHVSFFDQGGLWRSGTAGINLTGGVERVLTPPQDDYFRRFVDAAEGGRSGSALIDQLHIHEVHTDMEEAIGAVNHWTRVYSNGGRYAGAGSGT